VGGFAVVRGVLVGQQLAGVGGQRCQGAAQAAPGTAPGGEQQQGGSETEGERQAFACRAVQQRGEQSESGECDYRGGEQLAAEIGIDGGTPRSFGAIVTMACDLVGLECVKISAILCDRVCKKQCRLCRMSR
jgi:hypothetical protein